MQETKKVSSILLRGGEGDREKESERHQGGFDRPSNDSNVKGHIRSPWN